MRELDKGIADVMRTSSQTEVEDCELVYSNKSVFADEYTDEAFCDEFGEMVAEAEPSDQASESDDADGYMEDPNSLWGRIERQMGAKEYKVWLAEYLANRKEQTSSGLIIRHLSGFNENNQPILEIVGSSEDDSEVEQQQEAAPADQASEFGQSEQADNQQFIEQITQQIVNTQHFIDRNNQKIEQITQQIESNQQLLDRNNQQIESNQQFIEQKKLEINKIISEVVGKTRVGSNPNHLEEPPRRESCEEKPKVKQINIHIDLYKLLAPVAAIAGVAILALGYRKQNKLIGGLKAIKNQLKSTKKD